VVLLGDINNPPTGPVTAKLLGAGFTDTYGSVQSTAGYTCCADIFTGVSTSSQRIDYILAKGITATDTSYTVLDGRFQGRDGQDYRISDHNGVLTTLTYH
jgi:endonuclease/exonuclease/phosphatase (EEP) superfamily protein YafD